jgi:DNA-binding CsgD family transcriptional regulator
MSWGKERVMTAPVRVSERDLHTLLGIVADDRDDLPATGLPESLLSDLMAVVHGDVVAFYGLDSGRKTHWFGQDVPAEDISAGVHGFWARYWDCPFSSYPDRTGDLRSVTKISDFYSARQWHSAAIYSDYYRAQEFEHQLALCLPAAPGSYARPGRTIRLAFFRGRGRDFSKRDRALLALLRPHLHRAYLTAERRRHPTPQLTPRQWELLRLVAAGHTNAQIARQLGLSEGTVRIHLQNIYARLQVPSRTAAVTRAFPDLATT